MSLSNREKQKITLTVIYATVILVVCLAAVLLVSSFAGSDTSTPTPKPTNPVTYVSADVTEDQLHSGSLILVNKSNKYFFDANPEMVSIPTSEYYGLRDGYLKADPVALEALQTMFRDLRAKVSDSYPIILTAYRSEAEQTALNNGTPAGYSDFHTGMSFELKANEDGYKGIDSVEKYKWIYENAHKYGFIVRYPADSAEKSFSRITGVTDYAYVFRYVGVVHATYIYENDLCLEEYLELLRLVHGISNPLTVRAADAKSYEIYYAGSAPQIEVPEKYSYEISGDNMNGYIVTVAKSKTK